MNKKISKVLYIILFSFIGVLLITGCVLWFIDAQLLKRIVEYAKDLLNQPLPIVGITTATCLIFLWRVIVSTNYGKKVINALKNALNEIKNEHEKYKLDSEKEKQDLANENKLLRQQLADICALSTNKKIKNYGKGLLTYGEETTNNETKAD